MGASMEPIVPSQPLRRVVSLIASATEIVSALGRNDSGSWANALSTVSNRSTSALNVCSHLSAKEIAIALHLRRTEGHTRQPSVLLGFRSVDLAA